MESSEMILSADILIAFYFVFLCLLAAFWDIATYTIPNWLTALIAVSYIPIAFAFDMSEVEVLLNLSAGLVMLALGFLLFAFNLFGGGDVKFLAALAIWTGFVPLPGFLVFMALSGGVLVLLLLVIRKLPLKETKILWWENLKDKNKGIPYGVAISSAAIWWAFIQNFMIVKSLG